jgi:hypothetical protein
MAKVSNNLLVRGLSGNLGNQFTVRSNKNGRTIVSAKNNFENNRTHSPAQLAQQQAFREAVAYGQAMKGEEVYITRANGGPRSPYNVAVADWFHRPQILEIDLSGWANGDGGTIRVRAQDDVMVTGVQVAIKDETGTVLEEGEAQNAGALWWEYSTTQAAANNMRVTVTATDLPGHVTERTKRPS